jgi:SAM-dependent methyltransferase
MMTSWDKKYASGKYSTGEPHKLLALLTVNLLPGKALDLACGTGRHAIFLAAKGWQVTAVDSSRVGLEIARKCAAEKNLAIDFQLADLEKGEFEIRPDSYDLICDFYYLQTDLFPKMKVGLRSGGIVMVVVHIYGKDEEKRRFSLPEGKLPDFFSDFEILHYRENLLIGLEASGHQRRTAEIVAKKP